VNIWILIKRRKLVGFCFHENIWVLLLICLGIKCICSLQEAHVSPYLEGKTTQTLSSCTTLQRR